MQDSGVIRMVGYSDSLNFRQHYRLIGEHAIGNVLTFFDDVVL